MDKIREIVGKLTDKQKIALVCDGNTLSDPTFNALGVPKVTFAHLDERLFVALCRTWNKRLFAQAIKVLYATADGATCLVCPPCVPSPYPTGAYLQTEEPCLVAEMYSAAGNYGVTLCLNARTPREYFADGAKDPRTLHEYYNYVIEQTDCTAVLSAASARTQGRKYNFVDGVPVSRLVKELGEGNMLCMNGGQTSLAQSLEAYYTMKAGIASGEVTMNEFAEACDTFDVLTPELLDTAVERVLAFAFDCVARSETNDGAEIQDEYSDCNAAQIMRKIADESVVLLKTPSGGPQFTNGNKYHVVCSAERAAEDGAALSDCSVSVWPQDLTVRNDGFVVECVEAAKKAHRSVIFVSSTGKLAALEKALLHELKQANVPVAVVCADGSVCAEASDYATALLLGGDVPHGTQAVLETIGGNSPSGKLINCCYADVEETRKRVLRFLAEDSNHKVGQFVGYRRVVSGDETTQPTYYFGYGLTYAKFSVSDAEVTNGGVRLNMTNNGIVNGKQVVEVYIGKADSGLARPRYKLAGFTKVNISAGQTAQVFVPFDIRRMAVYDAKSGKTVVENGEYEVYIATSSCNVVKQLILTVNDGTTLYSCTSNINDYVPTVGNIVDDDFTLKAVKDPKASPKKPVKGIKRTVFGAIGVGLAFIVGPYVLEIGYLLLFVGGVIFSWGLTMLIVSAVRRGKDAKRLAANKKDTDNKQNAVNVPVGTPFEKLFDREFEVTDVDDSIVDETFVEEVQTDDEPLDGNKFAEIVMQNANAQGLAVTDEDAGIITAAMSACRLLCVEHSPSTQKLWQCVAHAVGAEFVVDNVVDTDKTEYYFAPDGSARPTVAALAAGQGLKPVIVYLVTDGTHSDFVTPFMRYIVRPEYPFETLLGKVKLTVANVWFVLAGAGGGFPAEISAQSFTLYTQCGSCTPVGEQSTLRATSAQFLAFADQAAAQYRLDEKYWKAIDNAESVVRSATPYHLGNRECVTLERLNGVLISFGMEQPRILDIIVGCKLLPHMLALLRTDIEQNADKLQKLLVAFGDDNVDAINTAVARSAFGGKND